MTDDLDRQVRQALKRRRRSPRALLYVCILAAVVGTSGYLWLNYDNLAKLAFAERSAASPVVNSSNTGVTQIDFEALKRQTAESLQSKTEDIDAQKAELKRLSDQVSALAAKIEALQSAAAPAPQQAAVPIQPPIIAARKKPPAPKASGPISVGGSPLPPGPSADR